MPLNTGGQNLVDFCQRRLVVQVSQVRFYGCQVAPAGGAGLNTGRVAGGQPLPESFGNERPEQIEFQAFLRGHVVGKGQQVIGEITGKNSGYVQCPAFFGGD